MNREIKFRAWFKVQKKMVYNLGFDQFSFKTIDDLNGTEYMPSVYDMDIEKYDDNGELIGYEATFNFEVMQYIGLKDRNGKEVYEGDILKLYNGLIGYIEYFGECFTFKHIGKFSGNSYGYRYDTGEIIGNVFENPELLEVTNDKEN